ncbi:MAG: PhzF family phenazine biosynthesis protein [Holophagaceae bacterium]
MTSVDVEIIRAFVDGAEGGNPAGFVLDGDAFTPDQRQRIAAALGLSETAFVTASPAADVALVFHTPTKAIPHCGHATVAAFSRLWELGRLTGKEATNATVDGVRRLFREDGAVFMEQVAPALRPLPASGEATPAAVLAALGLGAGDLLPGFAPVLAHNGNGLLLVPLKAASSLPRLAPDLDAIARISEAERLIGFYVFAPTPEGPRDAEVRMFAPAFGIPEEAATGMMAGPLGWWLHHVLGRRETAFVISQGRFMDPPSPSLLHVVLEGAGLKVGGQARLVERRTVRIEG